MIVDNKKLWISSVPRWDMEDGGNGVVVGSGSVVGGCNIGVMGGGRWCGQNGWSFKILNSVIKKGVLVLSLRT